MLSLPTLPSRSNLLLQQSPRLPQRRPGFRSTLVVLFIIAVILLMLGICFPSWVERIHCMLGLPGECQMPTRLPGVDLYDGHAMQKSCTPANESGKVIVVTGSAGFIGFNAALALKKRGDGVVGIDNFNDYYPVSLKRARAAELTSAGVHTVGGDINDAILLQRVLKICRPTHVLHLAAQAGVRYAAVKPLAYVESNIRGTSVLLETIRQQQPMPKYIYASSSSVYGRNKKVPFSEMDRVDQPASLYAATKRSCELLASVYHNIYNVSATGLRFFTVYGPWGRPDMAALAFTHHIMEGLPVKIFKSAEGDQLARDFTYIDDIVQGILGAIDTAGPGNDRIFNLGNTHPHTVDELVDGLEYVLKKKALREYVEVPNLGDVLHTHSNTSAAAEAFGYDPKVTLDEGLRRFAAWFFAYYGPEGSNLRPDELHYRPGR